MRDEATFIRAEHKALIPWPRPAISWRGILAITVFVAGLTAVAQVLEGKPLVTSLIATGLAVVIALFVLLGWRFLGAKLSAPTPLALDARGMLAESIWGDVTVDWKDVAELSFKLGVRGLDPPHFAFILMVRKSNGETIELNVPPMSQEEGAQLRVIFEDLSRLHRFLFRSDHP